MMATVDLDMADLFSDPEDIEELIENEGTREVATEGGEEEHLPGETGEEGDAAGKEDQENIDMPTTEPKKKRVVKNPQPKLNPDRLCGPRGMAIIEDIFRDMTFRGKGYEKEDLDKVMKKLEHWAHRLFPKLPFDDCLEKIEKLGTKKQVQTHVKKIRLNMNVLHEQFQKDQLLEEEPDEEPRVQEVQEDVFDELLREHASNTAVAHAPVQVTVSATPAGLSEEQHQRMIRNRQLAEEKRQAKLQVQKQQQERSEDALGGEQGSETESGRTVEHDRGMENERTVEQSRGTENGARVEKGGLASLQASHGSETETEEQDGRDTCGQTVESCVTSEQVEMDTSL